MTKTQSPYSAEQWRKIEEFLERVEASPPHQRDARRSERTDLGDFHAKFLERYGRHWVAAPLPPDIPRGRKKHCWENARALALKHPHFAYVEGMEALSGHAYCVDGAGQVVDNTWPADQAPPSYSGVAFDVGVVAAMKLRVGAFYSGMLLTVEYRYPWLWGDVHWLLDRRWYSGS